MKGHWKQNFQTQLTAPWSAVDFNKEHDDNFYMEAKSRVKTVKHAEVLALQEKNKPEHKNPPRNKPWFIPFKQLSLSTTYPAEKNLSFTTHCTILTLTVSEV